MTVVTGERFTLDTNVLVYAVDREAGERHRVARDLLYDSALAGTCILTLQAIAEFFSVAIRKGRMPIAQARGHVSDLKKAFTVVAAAPATLDGAMDAVSAQASHSGTRCCGRVHARPAARFSSARIFSTVACWKGSGFITPSGHRHSGLADSRPF